MSTDTMNSSFVKASAIRGPFGADRTGLPQIVTMPNTACQGSTTSWGVRSKERVAVIPASSTTR